MYFWVIILFSLYELALATIITFDNSSNSLIFFTVEFNDIAGICNQALLTDRMTYSVHQSSPVFELVGRIKNDLQSHLYSDSQWGKFEMASSWYGLDMAYGMLTNNSLSYSENKEMYDAAIFNLNSTLQDLCYSGREYGNVTSVAISTVFVQGNVYGPFS
ncbi:hypothetical protein DFJ63DRAFT_320429 [Scheffersomyces coipomensis]|uniref:uncharacterized protein n=1 Tax=Scheffersomyces coipomensis TaxID=1788519 RepID=UPI00315DE661